MKYHKKLFLTVVVQLFHLQIDSRVVKALLSDEGLIRDSLNPINGHEPGAPPRRPLIYV